MKKIFIAILFLLALTGCDLFKKENSDALLFKEEYEKLNGEVSSSGKSYLEISIDEDNPVVYTNASKIKKLIDDKESGVIYFGYPACPWCRNALPVLLDALEDEEIEVLYYQNLKAERDQKTINDQGEIEVVNKGTDNYQLLLELFDEILPEYTMDKNGKTYSFKEKRIYVPIVIFINNGKVVGSHTATVSSHQNPYKALDKKQKEELYNIYKKYIEKTTTCGVNAGC